MDTNVSETNCRLRLQSTGIVWLHFVYCLLISEYFYAYYRLLMEIILSFHELTAAVRRFKVDVICCFVTSVPHIVDVMRQSEVTGGVLSIFINNLGQAREHAVSTATKAKNSCAMLFI